MIWWQTPCTLQLFQTKAALQTMTQDYWPTLKTSLRIEPRKTNSWSATDYVSMLDWNPWLRRITRVSAADLWYRRSALVIKNIARQHKINEKLIDTSLYLSLYVEITKFDYKYGSKNVSHIENNNQTVISKEIFCFSGDTNDRNPETRKTYSKKNWEYWWQLQNALILWVLDKLMKIKFLADRLIRNKIVTTAWFGQLCWPYMLMCVKVFKLWIQEANKTHNTDYLQLSFYRSIQIRW